MTRKTTPIPRRRPLPDITDDFTLDELVYDRNDVDPPEDGLARGDEGNPDDAWSPEDPPEDRAVPGPTAYPQL